MTKAIVDYDAMREDLLSLKEALSFIVKADESDAGGYSRFSGLAYAKVAEAGLVHCEQAIERLKKAEEGRREREGGSSPLIGAKAIHHDNHKLHSQNAQIKRTTGDLRGRA